MENVEGNYFIFVFLRVFVSHSTSEQIEKKTELPVKENKKPIFTVSSRL